MAPELAAGISRVRSVKSTGIRVGNWLSQRQAQALLSAPDILIFDEPTASLDGDTGRKILEFVKKEVLNEKRCILIVTHDNRIFDYADRIMTMEDGRVVGFTKGESRA